jgi:hypothetical protein
VSITTQTCLIFGSLIFGAGVLVGVLDAGLVDVGVVEAGVVEVGVVEALGAVAAAVEAEVAAGVGGGGAGGPARTGAVDCGATAAAAALAAVAGAWVAEVAIGITSEASDCPVGLVSPPARMPIPRPAASIAMTPPARCRRLRLAGAAPAGLEAESARRSIGSVEETVLPQFRQ